MTVKAIKALKIEYSDDGMWGESGPGGYDILESYAKFEEMVTAKLAEQYPGAEIEMSNGINTIHQTWDPEIGWEDSEDVAWAIHPIWESFEWAVEE